MKTSLLHTLMVLSVLTATVAGAAQADYEFESSVPRAVSLISPGAAVVPVLQLNFYYDAKGRILLNPGARVGTNLLTGSATIGKLVKGVRAYTVTTKGLNLKSLSLTLKGQVGRTYATCTYKGPEGKVTLTNLPVTLELISPVKTRFTLLSQIDSRGKITGSGSIQSGYGNDSTNKAVLTGSSNKTSLSWQLKQGSQRISFSGKKGTNGFVGTLVATIPPASGSYKSFLFPGFSGNPPQGNTATFRGSISQTPAQAGLPSPAEGATISVSSDLNANGFIDSSERFTATADEDGKYNLVCAVKDGGRALIEIALDGYATQLRVLDPIRLGASINNNFSLRPLANMTISSTGATSGDGKLELLDLPSTVTTVQARVFNPATEADQFPGEFADDRGSLLISSVFTSIEAQDNYGEKVTDLERGTTLRMKVPKETWGTLKDLRSGNGQIDAPLYYYDESTGEWKRSNTDGWLENAQQVKIPEDRLADIRQGTFDDSVFVVGLIRHLSYWNLDWPVETHACVQGVLLDAGGNPVAGASVTVKGVTYTGSTSPQVTGADGRFCADIMRSETPGEDVDGNGTAGQTHQVNVAISHQGKMYNFGPFDAPTAQSTCESGSCFNLGPLQLAAANELEVRLWTITGTVAYSDGGEPVVGASVMGFDEALESDIWLQFITNSAVTFFATTDNRGQFSLTVPALSGLTIFATQTASPGAHTVEFATAQTTISAPSSEPLMLVAERYRTSQILDSVGGVVGAFYQYGTTLSGYVYLTAGGKTFWGVPAEDKPFVLPSLQGAPVTWNLLDLEDGGTGTVLGTITFSATTSIGGIWQTTGVSLSGTWGN